MFRKTAVLLLILTVVFANVAYAYAYSGTFGIGPSGAYEDTASHSTGSSDRTNAHFKCTSETAQYACSTRVYRTSTGAGATAAKNFSAGSDFAMAYWANEGMASTNYFLRIRTNANEPDGVVAAISWQPY